MKGMKLVWVVILFVCKVELVIFGGWVMMVMLCCGF